MDINIRMHTANSKYGEKSDKRLLKTKRAIVGALIELLTQKDLSEITVTELAQKARINRKTFYLHYDKIDDVIEDFGNDLLMYSQSILRDYLAGGHEDLSPLFSAINRAIENDLEFFRAFVRSGAYQLFIGASEKRHLVYGIRVTLSKYLQGSIVGQYAVEYIVNGVCAMYVMWLGADMPTVSLETVGEYACAFVSSNIEYLRGRKDG